MGSANDHRPTYRAAVILTENDTRNGAGKAGLVDWSVPTPGFEPIEERLAELKVRLTAAASKDDLEDVGRRCREPARDVMTIVFRSAMVPAGEKDTSPSDPKDQLRHYLSARLPGDDNEGFRSFLKSALALANATAHSGSRARAIAAAQATISLVRATEAIARSPEVADTTDPEGSMPRTAR